MNSVLVNDNYPFLQRQFELSTLNYADQSERPTRYPHATRTLPARKRHRDVPIAWAKRAGNVRRPQKSGDASVKDFADAIEFLVSARPSFEVCSAMVARTVTNCHRTCRRFISNKLQRLSTAISPDFNTNVVTNAALKRTSLMDVVNCLARIRKVSISLSAGPSGMLEQFRSRNCHRCSQAGILTSKLSQTRSLELVGYNRDAGCAVRWLRLEKALDLTMGGHTDLLAALQDWASRT
jgi:hypothetical protein